LAAMPSAGPRAPTSRPLEAYAALRRERDELAVQLAQIEAYQPGIADAKKRVARVDGASWVAR
jgi:hypothetical protein